MSVDYGLVLSVKYPGTIWALNGDTYDGLDWMDSSPKPTQAELDALWPQVHYEQQMKIVDAQRKTAYTTESDPVFFQYQRGDATEQEWLDAVQAVKDRYPYPS